MNQIFGNNSDNKNNKNNDGINKNSDSNFYNNSNNSNYNNANNYNDYNIYGNDYNTYNNSSNINNNYNGYNSNNNYNSNYWNNNSQNNDNYWANKNSANQSQNYNSNNYYVNNNQNYSNNIKQNNSLHYMSNQPSYVINANKRKDKTNINKVLRIFCVLMILIGISMMGKSIYALTFNRPKQKDNPVVEINKMGKEVTIEINTQYPIREMSYKWNDGETTTLKGNGTINVSKTIEIPNGNNVLKLEIVDNFGNKTQYQKQYIYQSTDPEKPKIELSKSGNKLVIKATDNVKMSYVTYQWNNDDEVRVDSESNDQKEMSVEIDVPKGENKLLITAVDGEQNRETDEEKIIGDTKPTFTMSSLGDDFVIKAQDDEGIESISVVIDDGTPIESTGIKKKEITATVPISNLSEGTHKIKVTVTNINGISNTQETNL